MIGDWSTVEETVPRRRTPWATTLLRRVRDEFSVLGPVSKVLRSLVHRSCLRFGDHGVDISPKLLRLKVIQ